jgi:glutamate dehydrogenase
LLVSDRGSSELTPDPVTAPPGDVVAELPGPFSAFTKAYTARIPDDEFPLLSPDELHAELADAFAFLAERGNQPFAIRVFNPQHEGHGYHAPGSVIEIVTDDRPFLIDSVLALLARRDHAVARSFHPVVGTVRDATGNLVDVVRAVDTDHRESFQHYELEERLDEEEAADLIGALEWVLSGVQAVVDDFEPMRRAVDRMIGYAREDAAFFPDEDVEETVAFLEWLLDDHFVFLGYREYDIVDVDGEPALVVDPGSGLGLLRNEERSKYATPVPLSELPPDVQERYQTSDQLVISKTNAYSTVHRDARMDYIGLRLVDESGRHEGEARLVGLFTSKAYMATGASIPILRDKLRRILAQEDLIEGSHDYKVIVQLFESFPMDELFSISREDLRKSLLGLLESEEHQRVRLFVRRDTLNRNVSILVVAPRERFNAELRQELQQLFLQRFDGESIDYRLSLGESGDARIHFTVWPKGDIPSVSTDDLEAEVYRLTRTWEDRVFRVLSDRVGEAEAKRLVDAHADRFPAYYQSSTPLPEVATAFVNVERLIGGDERLLVDVYNEVDSDEGLTRVAVYSKDGKRDLSAMLPLVEDLGLRVIEEVPTRIKDPTDELFLHDFGVLGPEGTALNTAQSAHRVADTLWAALTGAAESDSLHRLVVVTDLDYRQINVLRAYRSYWHLVTPAFTKEYVADTLVAHPEVSQDLMRLFEARFGPEGDEGTEAELRLRILDELDEVASLDEDRILRGFLGLIDATLRTSAYIETGSLAFKFLSEAVPDMPAPAPLFEIFVFARDVAGVHLRAGRVARGGIRWSTRREDYRTEVLGLMKAQKTKNVVIVPTGAKGGFVLRRFADQAGPTPDEIRGGYETFIRGLLDITDNLVDGVAVHPNGVRCHDIGDPYFVVAADRGTATFSDTANAISAEYDFWLDDAFASGGSTGYDHKALGITARGAWESVRRHFVELGVDVDTDPVTVVGIGDMSGDVFGNGMLLSSTIRLIAAFDHRHVFVDPNPPVDAAFDERARLASLGRSSWADYDESIISPGGGVFPRSAKRIDVSEQMAERFGIRTGALTPNELISALLKAPTDLIWNGGIGTYVKGSTESNADAMDRANDSLRVNGNDLRARVVGEGGNLGFTQAGRVEFSRSGGRIYTDFVDNCGGVHCSDREVNIKILLRLAELDGALGREERNALIESVAGDVVDAIVYDNFLQAQILAQEAASSADRIEAYEDLMVDLEEHTGLDRHLEGLPSGEQMMERSRDGMPMERPELAVIMSYAKQQLSNDLVSSDLPDSPEFNEDLRNYFPTKIVDRFGDYVDRHPLRRELIATIVANQVLNSMGSTFVNRLEAEMGASPAQIVWAYRVARDVTLAGQRWAAIEELTGTLDPVLQRDMLDGVDRLVETVARVFIAQPVEGTMAELIDVYGKGFNELSSEIQSIGPKRWQEQNNEVAQRLIDHGAPPALAYRHAYQDELVHGTDIVDVANSTGRPVLDVAKAFFRAGQSFHLDWLHRQLEGLPAETRWQRWARLSLAYDLMALRRRIVERIFEESPDSTADEAIDAFIATHLEQEGRLTRLMRMMRRDGVSDTAAVTVAIRQIQALAS